MYRRNIKFWGQDIVLAILKPDERISVGGAVLSIPEKHEGIVYTLQGKSDESLQKFVIVFQAAEIKGSVIAHEVWHLFFDVLLYVSGGDVELWAKELGKEIYAYSFGELFRMINKCIHNYREIENKKLKKRK